MQQLQINAWAYGHSAGMARIFKPERTIAGPSLCSGHALRHPQGRPGGVGEGRDAAPSGGDPVPAEKAGL